MFETPILLLIFNRPETTRIVFARIRELRPKYLFVAADGPRVSKVQDIENCKEVRELVVRGVDWECELKTLFRDENWGCGRGVSSAITWFFDAVEEGIILEDDCLPDPSFFSYCEKLLHLHRDDETIMHISGNNFLEGRIKVQHSYYYSIYPHVWGWATWRNRWKKCNYSMTPYHPNALDSVFESWKLSTQEINFWKKIFEDLAQNNPNDIWCYRWTYAIWKNQGVSILPSVNLVTNIGFGRDATHTKGESAENFKIPSSSIRVDNHPSKIEIHRKADYFTFNHHFNIRPSFLQTVISKVKRLLLPLVAIWRRVRYGLVYRKFKNFTMIPKKNYIRNLELSRRFRNIEGAIVECGTWRGGMIAGMVSVVGNHKNYYLFDSFEGLPEAKEIDGMKAKLWQADKEGSFYFDNCRASESEAIKAMELAGAQNFTVKKGWFNSTLPDFHPSEGISILRLDGDWYDSTMECLTHLFPQVNRNGVVIVDDYYMWEGCSRAVHDYLSMHKLPFRISLFKGICFIVKS